MRALRFLHAPHPDPLVESSQPRLAGKYFFNFGWVWRRDRALWLQSYLLTACLSVPETKGPNWGKRVDLFVLDNRIAAKPHVKLFLRAACVGVS